MATLDDITELAAAIKDVENDKKLYVDAIKEAQEKLDSLESDYQELVSALKEKTSEL